MGNTIGMHAKQQSELPAGREFFKKDAFGNTISTTSGTGGGLLTSNNNRASRKTARANSNTNPHKMHQRGESNTRNNTTMTT